MKVFGRKNRIEVCPRDRSLSSGNRIVNLNDVLPSVVSVERYKRGTKGAKLVRKNAIEAGVKEYLIAKKDDLARSLQPELKELQVPEAKRSKKEKPNEAAP